MDTSKKYIEMCEKAEEIQKDYTPNAGDFCWNESWEDWFTVCCKRHCDMTLGYIDGEYFWLPRQDQLQEMVEWHGKNIGNAIRGYFMFDFATHESQIKYYLTMEQLWLAFVMKEKYQKVWNGKDWVKQGGER